MRRLAHVQAWRPGRSQHQPVAVAAVSAPAAPTGSLQLARLWERRDHEGRLFLSGTLNGLRLLMLPNQGKDSETDADYLLIVAENRKPRKAKE